MMRREREECSIAALCRCAPLTESKLDVLRLEDTPSAMHSKLTRVGGQILDEVVRNILQHLRHMSGDSSACLSQQMAGR